MDSQTMILMIVAFGALSSSIILSTLLIIVMRPKLIEGDVEKNVATLCTTVSPLPPTYVPNLASIPVADVAVVPPPSKRVFPTSLYTNDETERYFDNSAYSTVKRPRPSSTRSVPAYFDTFNSSETSFSESLKARISASRTDEETRSFMNGLAQSYAEHYETQAKNNKRRTLELLNAVNMKHMSTENLE